jgi:capsid protein
MINGKIVHLNPGEEAQQVSPEQPGPDFDPVTRLMLRLIARGAGSIYELLMADFSGMSYSSSKSVLTFVWKMQDDWQDWLIRSRKRRVYNVWVAKRMQARLLPFNAEAFDAVSWIKTPHSGFDPLEDAEALIKLRSAAFITYEDFFNARGENWEVKLDQAAREIARIMEKAKEYDVDPVLIANTLAPGIMQTGNPAAPAPVGAGTTRRGGAQD